MKRRWDVVLTIELAIAALILATALIHTSQEPYR